MNWTDKTGNLHMNSSEIPAVKIALLDRMSLTVLNEVRGIMWIINGFVPHEMTYVLPVFNMIQIVPRVRKT